jgi:WD40 repeat protein
LVGCVDLHNDHNVYVFRATGDMELVGKCKGDQNKIHDIGFCTKSNRFATGGSKHIYFWDADASGLDKKKGIYDGNPMTSFSCVAFGNDGICYAGGANSKIYKWDVAERKCTGTIAAHKGGFICAMRFVDGMLFSGGKDGDVHEIDIAGNCSKRSWSFNSLVRAVDHMNGNLLVGLRDGTIWHRPCEGGNGNAIMSSHNEGEVWGLDTHDGKVITSGDDNQVIFWDPAKRMKECGQIVSNENKKAKRGGASSLSNLPASQQSRCVAVSTHFLAVAGNDGTVTIRPHADAGNPCHTLTDSSEWIEVMAFSPDQKLFAVGSHDNFIYVYETGGWTLKGKCKGHSSYIMALDWSQDNEWLRTNCGAYELLFFKASDCS